MENFHEKQSAEYAQTMATSSAKNANGNTQKKSKEGGNFFVEVAKVVAISLAIIIPVRYFLIQPFYVKGASMEPNFYNFEYLIIDELSYRFNDPQRGDVVVLRNPESGGRYFIKRIIGLPGEQVEVKDRKVWVDGQQLDEIAYLDADTETWGAVEVTLDEGMYFVLGDNRNESLDSRVFGPVAQEEFVGRTWIRAWPLSRIDRFTTIEYNLE